MTVVELKGKTSSEVPGCSRLMRTIVLSSCILTFYVNSYSQWFSVSIKYSLFGHELTCLDSISEELWVLSFIFFFH